MRRLLALLVIVTSLSGCGHKYEKVGQYQLLADLVSTGDEEYRVNALSNVNGNVDLNNFSYLGDKEAIYCGRGRSLDVVNCSGYKEFFSRASHLIINKSPVNTYNYYLEFSPRMFNKALEKAMLTRGLDRVKLSATFDAFVVDYQTAMNSVNAEVRTYKDNVDKVKIINQVMDESGFYQNGGLESLELAQSVANAGLPPFSFTVAPEKFDAYFDSERKKIADLKQVTASITSNFKMRCVNSSFKRNSYNATCSVPESVTYNGAQEQSVNANITVLSKDFGTVPVHFKNNDANLLVESDGQTITVRNLTDKFVSIVSISIYYGAGDAVPISTFNWEKADAKYKELPPRAVSKIPVNTIFTPSDYRAYGKYFEFNGLTVQKAKNTNFEYGIAVKYTVGNRSVEETLFKTKKYNLYTLVAEK